MQNEMLPIIDSLYYIVPLCNDPVYSLILPGMKDVMPYLEKCMENIATSPAWYPPNFTKPKTSAIYIQEPKLPGTSLRNCSKECECFCLTDNHITPKFLTLTHSSPSLGAVLKKCGLAINIIQAQLDQQALLHQTNATALWHEVPAT